MKRSGLWSLIASISVLALWPLYCGAFAEDDWKDLIKVKQEIDPLGENPFGESWNSYTGVLSLRQRDIVLKGTGLPIIIERVHAEIGGTRVNDNLYYGFGDWGLNVPRITGMAPNNQVWAVYSSASPYYSYSRCTQFAGPPSNANWPDPSGWWKGYQLVTPEGGSQPLLKRASGNTLTPVNLAVNGINVNNFPGVTSAHWMAGCGPTTENEGVSGREGFVAVSPDGTKYWLSWLVYRASGGTPNPNCDPGQKCTPAFINLNMAHLLVRRIEDRFGNYLTYNYTGNLLTSIVASDSRSVTINWRSDLAEPVISSIVAQPATGAPRTWTYTYTTTGVPAQVFLSSAALPDGHAWSFGLTSLNDAMLPTHTKNSLRCNGTDMTFPAATNAGNTYSGTITHPSGLVGSFSFQVTRHGQSYVPYSCLSNGTTYSVGYSNEYDTTSLVSKTYTDRGANLTWFYGYGSLNRSWSKDCASGCVSTIASTETEPDGSYRLYTSSNKWDYTEGQILQVDDYAAGGTLMSSQRSAYAPPTTGPWPATIGDTMTYNGNEVKSEVISPKQQAQVIQSGDTYTWQVGSPLSSSYDQYGHPLHVLRSNSIAGQASSDDTAALYNDTTHWILGQSQILTNNNTGFIVSQTNYDGAGLVSSRQAFGLTIENYAWNAQGQLYTYTDGLSRTTTLTSYQYGVPGTITFPDATTEQIGVNPFAEVTSVKDQNANTTSYGRDTMGRVSSVTYPTGDVVAWTSKSITYSTLAGVELARAAGSWRGESVQGRHRIRTYFDGYFRPVLVEDMDTTTGIAIYTVKRFDYLGHATFESYPSTLYNETAGINYTYDGLGRLVQRQTVDGVTLESIAYLSGDRKQVTDADNDVTTTTYQAFDAPAYEAATHIVAPENTTTDIVRDVFGKPTSATQSGPWSGGSTSATRSWQYDSNQRLCRRTEPETGSTVYGYDAASQLIWEAKGQSGTGCVTTAPSTAILYTYYPSGLKHTEDASGTVDDTSFTYDPAGNLKTSANSLYTWTYTYNKLNLIESEQVVVNGTSHTLDPAYDALGHLSQKTYPDGTVIAYSPDAWGRPTQIGTYVTSIVYWPTSDAKTYTLGNLLTYSQTLDPRLRPSTQVTSYGVTPIQNFSYVYTNAGDLTSVSETAMNVDYGTFVYDGRHRLKNATGLWGSYAYSYDPLNNIRSRTGTNALTYNYNSSNRLSSLSGSLTRSYTYNAAGEITNDGVRGYALNAYGQVSAAASANYYYDANHKRIKVWKSTSSEFTLYDRSGAMAYSEVGSTKTDYLSLNGHTLIELTNGSPKYLHTDWQGSPRVETDNSRTVVWRESYSPFGAKLNGVADKVGYTGHAYDTETGLTYAQARFYDPAIGRFLSPDPVRLDDDFNLYAYVGNDPLGKTDPTGKNEAIIGGLGAGLIVIGGIYYQAQNCPTESCRAAAQTVTSWISDKFHGLISSVEGLLSSSDKPASDTPGTTPGPSSGGGDKPPSPSEVLTPNGQPVGEVKGGATPDVRTVKPGQLQGIIDDLKGSGATPGSKGSYPGEWYNLPDNQGGFGVRDSDDHGRTVDVNVPEVPDVTKIHEK